MILNYSTVITVATIAGLVILFEVLLHLLVKSKVGRVTLEVGMWLVVLLGAIYVTNPSKIGLVIKALAKI